VGGEDPDRRRRRLRRAARRPRPRDDATWLPLCGDETALPATAAILETPQPVERVLAVAPATSSHLADALRALELPQGPGQAWGAASRASRATCATCCEASAACRAGT
jgi:NADPH-dependent ferric siderophore reductase